MPPVIQRIEDDAEGVEEATVRIQLKSATDSGAKAAA